LDHVFHSNHFQLVELRRLGHVGSDHFPMLVELAIGPEPAERPEIDSVDAADRQEASETVEAAEQLHQEEGASERRERKQADQ
jgi:hypothetical protein